MHCWPSLHCCTMLTSVAPPGTCVHSPASDSLPRICAFASVWTSLALSVLTSICSISWPASQFGLRRRSSLERTKTDTSWFFCGPRVLHTCGSYLTLVPCSLGSLTTVCECLTYPPTLTEMNLLSTLLCFLLSASCSIMSVVI